MFEKELPDLPRFVPRSLAEKLEAEGREYAERGEHLKAIQAYSRAIDESPFWLAPYIHWRRGESYAALGRIEEAIADYRVHHNDAVCEEMEVDRRWRLVALLRESHQSESVIRAVQELVDHCTIRIKVDPAMQHYYYERARARAELKQYAAAIDDCRLALEALVARRAKTHKILQQGWKPDEADINKLREAILAESS